MRESRSSGSVGGRRETGGPTRKIFDPLAFLAAVTCHIPNRGEHLVRHYGFYSSVQRGRRRRQGREKPPLRPAPLSDNTATSRPRSALLWARSSGRPTRLSALPRAASRCG